VKLVEASVRYPVSVLVAVLLGVIFGTISLFRLPVQMIPTIDRPEITVTTPYPGAGPLEVEEEVTRRQEELLNTVEGLREMRSVSKEGESTIILKYDWGTNKDVARLDVSEKLGAVQGLPDDIEEPIVRALNSEEQTPIAWLVVSPPGELNTVRAVAEDVIKAQLERVPGVGQVMFFGGEEREVQVEVDLGALAARRITIPEVRGALLAENRNIKAGAFDEGKRRIGVRTVGRYREVAEVEQTIVRRDAGGVTRVRDVAQVRIGHEEPAFIVRQNGVPSFIFGVLQKAGSNTLEVMESVTRVMGELNARYAARGLELRVVYDASLYIDEAIDLVTRSLLEGAVLAVAVLLLFLRSGRAILVLGLSIPISLVTTFIFVALFGRTLNIISLAGLAFASGMVVDDAIVVLENVYRHRELGKGAFRAAYDGTVEVWGAILAATLTRIAVFVPILLVQEEAGQIFRDIAIAISIAVALSLLVAITVIPMLAARLLARGAADLESGGSGIARATTSLVERALDWVLLSTSRKASVCAGIVAASVALGWALLPPIDYLPEGNRNMVFASLRTPPGYNLPQNERILRLLEREILARPEVHRMFAVVRLEMPLAGVVLKEEFKDKGSIQNFIHEVERAAAEVPGVRDVFVQQAPLIRRGSFNAGNLEVRVSGDDLETIERLSLSLERALGAVPGVRFVNPSYEVGKPEFVVDVARVRAAELGLTVGEIGTIVETVVKGALVGTYDDGGREIDLRLRAPEGTIGSASDLTRAVIFAPSGQLVQVGDVARVVPRAGPTQIQHTDLQRSVELSVGLEQALPLAEGIARVEQALAPERARLPLGYRIELTGQASDLEQTWKAFRGAFLLAVVITYLLLASLFESFVLPLVILVSVPFAATGGVIALRLMHALDPSIKLDAITMLAFVILLGVVVNNAILLVHQTLHRLGEGAPPAEALRDGVRSRVRPILMTTATNVLGMAPLTFAAGSGSELYRGLGAVMIGGQILSTIFTFVLVPAVLSFVLRERAPAEVPSPAVPAG
jgi:HAE1 family hydrophobic/amphiphilic exporter-1